MFVSLHSPNVNRFTQNVCCQKLEQRTCSARSCRNGGCAGTRTLLLWRGTNSVQTRSIFGARFKRSSKIKNPALTHESKLRKLQQQTRKEYVVKGFYSPLDRIGRTQINKGQKAVLVYRHLKLGWVCKYRGNHKIRSSGVWTTECVNKGRMLK